MLSSRKHDGRAAGQGQGTILRMVRSAIIQGMGLGPHAAGPAVEEGDGEDGLGAPPVPDQDDTRADQDDAQPARPPFVRFFSTHGPLDGPILRRHEPHAPGIVGEPGAAGPIGIAYPVGLVEYRRGPAQTFR